MAKGETDRDTPATTATTATNDLGIPDQLLEICALIEARAGNLDYLAAHIAEGREIGPESRDFLARFLRGDKSVRPPPGNRRTGAQELSDSLMLLRIAVLTKELGSEYKAINAYLESSETMNRETLRSRIKRARAVRKARVRKP